MCFLEPAKIISWVYALLVLENKLWYLKIVLKHNKQYENYGNIKKINYIHDTIIYIQDTIIYKCVCVRAYAHTNDNAFMCM